MAGVARRTGPCYIQYLATRHPSGTLALEPGTLTWRHGVRRRSRRQVCRCATWDLGSIFAPKPLSSPAQRWPFRGGEANGERRVCPVWDGPRSLVRAGDPAATFPFRIGKPDGPHAPDHSDDIDAKLAEWARHHRAIRERTAPPRVLRGLSGAGGPLPHTTSLL